MANMQEIASQLRLLETETGRIDPAVVVEAAHDPASPLHDFFEWDDSEAARQHRLGQARQLIRRVKIEVTVHSIPLQVTRYLRDKEDGQDSYRDILQIRGQEDTARAIIIDEMSRVSKAVRRAKSVAAVLGVTLDINQIDALAASIVSRATAVGTEPEGSA